MPTMVIVSKGRWVQDGDGCFDHIVTSDKDFAHVMLKETTKLWEASRSIKATYKLKAADCVELSYKWPAWVIGPEWRTVTPTYIVDDEGMSLFMAVHADLQDTTLCVKVLKAPTFLSAMAIADKRWCSRQRNLTKPSVRMGNPGGVVIKDVEEESIRKLGGVKPVAEGSRKQLEGGDKVRKHTRDEKGKQHIESNVASPTSQQKRRSVVEAWLYGSNRGVEEVGDSMTDNITVSANKTCNANSIVIGNEILPAATLPTHDLEARSIDNHDFLTGMLKAVEEMLMCVNESDKVIERGKSRMYDTRPKLFHGKDSSSMEYLSKTSNENREKNEILARWKEMLSSSTAYERDGTRAMDVDRMQPIARTLTFNEISDDTDDINGALQLTLGVASKLTNVLPVTNKPAPVYYSLSSSENSSYGVRNANESRPFDSDGHSNSSRERVRKMIAESERNLYCPSTSPSESDPDGPIDIPPQIRQYYGESMALEERDSLPKVQVGGPSQAPAKSPCVLSTYKPVPTVLYDRDAPPYVDEPAEEETLHRAIYDADYEGDDLFLGRVFKNKDDCATKLAIHAIRRKFHFIYAKSKPTMILVVCVSNTCPWRVYTAKMDNSECYEIRSMTLHHTCSVDARGDFHKQASTGVIGKLMRAKYIGCGRGPRPNELRRMLRQEFSLNVSYWKAWRAREIAMDNAMGSARGSFALIQPYFKKLKETNPNSLTYIETDVESNGVERFKYLFMALGASIQGYETMRKVIVIDGTHLRGRYGGCLVAASTQDANFQIFPIGFGIINSENDESWTWFLSKLSEVAPDSYDLVFVSDRHSSIYQAIKQVYPMASHAACIVHLQRNIVSIFKDSMLSGLVSVAARAYRISDFNRVFAQIREINANCAEYLEGIGFEHWTRSHFVGNRYNVMTSNIAESINNVLTMARDYPIISILETLRTTLVTWFALRREAAEADDNILPTKVQEMVIENYEKGSGYHVSKIGDGIYEVRDDTDASFAVHLWERACSCREFQLMTIPCTHAIAGAIREGLKVDTLVDVHHTTPYLRLSYQGLIMPVPDMDKLAPSPNDMGGGKLAPPFVRRPSGRPRKRRIPSRGEFTRTNRKRCTRCKSLGHNKATCHGPVMEH